MGPASGTCPSPAASLHRSRHANTPTRPSRWRSARVDVVGARAMGNIRFLLVDCVISLGEYSSCGNSIVEATQRHRFKICALWSRGGRTPVSEAPATAWPPLFLWGRFQSLPTRDPAACQLFGIWLASSSHAARRPLEKNTSTRGRGGRQTHS